MAKRDGGNCPVHGQKEGEYCSDCGRELEPTLEPVLGPPYAVGGMGSCPGCDYQLNHRHQAYCPGCGEELIWICR